MDSLQQLYDGIAAVDLDEVDARIQALSEELLFLKTLRSVHGLLALPKSITEKPIFVRERRTKIEVNEILDKIKAYLLTHPGVKAGEVGRALGNETLYYLRNQPHWFICQDYRWFLRSEITTPVVFSVEREK